MRLSVCLGVACMRSGALCVVSVWLQWQIVPCVVLWLCAWCAVAVWCVGVLCVVFLRKINNLGEI